MKIIFLLLLFCLQKTHGKNEKCGIYEVRSMEGLIRYKSYKQNANDGQLAKRQIKTTKMPINSKEEGDTVYIGYMEVNSGINKCVAIKIIDELDEYENARNVLDKIKQMLERKQRMHIIEMIDAGLRLGDDDNNAKRQQGILIMELGTLSFADLVYGSNSIYKNDEDIGKMVLHIAIPLNEFHKVAMHLDVKPENFILVESEIETRKFLAAKKNVSVNIWKITDFNGSQMNELIGENEQINANAKVWPEIRINSAIYNSPEYFTSQILSQKTDIWSIGIIMIELLLLHRFYSENNIYKKPEKSEIIKHLTEIADLYRGFTLKKIQNSKEFAKYTVIKYFSNKIWLNQYYDSIVFILQIWNEFPQMAILITNLLSPNRTFRMTAHGILEFIAGRCVPEEIRKAQNVQHFQLFNGFLLGEFEQILEDWQNTKLEQYSVDEQREKLGKLLKIVTKRQEKVHKTLQKCPNVCETGN